MLPMAATCALASAVTPDAAEFAHALERAESLESKEQYGTSIAWFLKAKRIYPESSFAREGIARNSAAILPEKAGNDDALVESLKETR